MKIKKYNVYKQREHAEALYKLLMDSGFLMEHPMFSIRIETMDSYKNFE